MTVDEWGGVVEDACGVWNCNPTSDLGSARIRSWSKRWQHGETFELFTRVVRELERTHKYWPAVHEVHAVLDRLKASAALRRGDRQFAPSGRVTPAERRQIARDLERAVAQRLKRNGGDGGPMAIWLQKLADLYTNNAALDERGERIVWPPWVAIGEIPVGLSLQERDRHARRRQRSLEAEALRERGAP